MGEKVIVDLKNKVVIDIEEYCKEINELEFLRELVIKFDIHEITDNEFRDELNKANKIYHWWI